MAFKFTKFVEGINLIPKSVSTVSQMGDIDVTSGDGKANYFNGTTSSPVVTESQPATLTNKTMNGDDNTFINIGTASIVPLTASKALISDANGFLSVSTVSALELSRLSGIGSKADGISDANTLTNKTISGLSNSISNIPLSALPADIATTDTTQTFTNKTISGSANSVSNISLTSSVTGILPVANGGTNISSYTTGDVLYASGGTTLSKLAIGTNGQVLKTISGVPSWQANSLNLNVVTVNNVSSYSISSITNIVIGSQSSTAANYILPSASVAAGLEITISKIDTSFNAITILPTGSDTIMSGSNTTLNTQNESIILISDGVSNWYILDRYIPSVWTNYTPTGSWTTNTTYTGRWRRNGDSIDIDLKIATAGAPDATVLTINLPSGITIATSKLTVVDNTKAFGDGSIYQNSSSKYFEAIVTYNSTTSLSAQGVSTNSSGSGALIQLNSITNNNFITFTNNDFVTLRGTGIPITNWNG